MTRIISPLPAPERKSLQLGYLKLSDSAPLIVAELLGLYKKYDLDVQLSCEVSWANLRDKLVVEELDAAQMLAPLPLTTTMGLGGFRTPLISGLILSFNGNAITLDRKIDTELRERIDEETTNPLTSSKALGKWLSENPNPLTLASAHTFSCHTLQLRQWLELGGIDIDRAVKLVVLPPEQMVDSLSRGLIDGFCVGEPWSSIAVQQGIGSVQTASCQLRQSAPEKVLAVRKDWHQRFPTTHLRLRLALMEACQWLASPDNRQAIIPTLSRRLDLLESHISPSLLGHYPFQKGSKPLELKNFHLFESFDHSFSWFQEGKTILESVGRIIGKEFDSELIDSVIEQCFRSDLYEEAFKILHADDAFKNSAPN